MPRKSNTRAAQGAGSIRQRSDGTWEARITIGTNPGTGKPDRKTYQKISLRQNAKGSTAEIGPGRGRR